MGRRGYTCGLDAAVDVIDGKWKPMIIWALHASGSLRFGALRRQISGITEKVLAQQLRELEGDGIVHREVHDEIPPKVVYSLTRRGEALNAALEPLGDWGSRYVLEEDAEPAVPAGQSTSAAG